MAAVVLASLSLWLCQVVMVLVKNLTCYVAHATGTTFWSTVAVIGQVLLAMLEWIGYWFGGALVLAVIGGPAPAAMIMYASDQTEKWTKKWVSMFVSTLFQQVVVLVILYIEKLIFLGDGGVTGGAVTGADGANFTEAMFGLLGLLLITYLAVKAPRFINPEGAGFFGGFAQMLQMAGTIVVAGAAIAAAAAGAAGSGAAAPTTSQVGQSGWANTLAQGGTRQAGNVVGGGNAPAGASAPAGGEGVSSTPTAGSGTEAPSIQSNWHRHMEEETGHGRDREWQTAVREVRQPWLRRNLRYVCQRKIGASWRG